MKKFLKNTMVAMLSGAVGFINGFFGGGGGMLLVPLLEKVLKCSVKKSHATAIVVILPVSIAGAITYIASGFFEWTPVLSAAGGCVAGGATGALLLKKLPSNIVAFVFALIMIGVGVKLTFFRG